MTDVGTKGATPEMVAALNRPTPADRVQWRAGNTRRNNSEITVLAYMDNRYVQDTLDEVVLPENWQNAFQDSAGGVRAGIGILIYGEWVWKWDAAPRTDIEAEKGGHSDAMKRAAVQWGIGRDLYDYPDTVVPTRSWTGRDGKERYEPAVLPQWNGQQWFVPGVQNAPQAPRTAPVAAQPQNAAPEMVALVGQGVDPRVAAAALAVDGEPQPGSECPKHPGAKLFGQPGSLYHKAGEKPDGKADYCRPYQQPRQPRR